MTSKKLLSALLALVFALSLFTALPVAAEGTVTATANGTAIQSGDTISAVSTLVFTLPNAIADLATVTFEEVQKGKAASGWATRLFDGEVNGNNLTVNFALGDLAMNSEYRFTFPDVAEPFTFKTAATADSYYIYDNFDRYLENNSIAAGGSDATELDAPWWLGQKMYGRVLPSFVKENGDTVLRITSGGTNSSNDMMGSVSYDNAYAPAATGLLGQKFTTEVTFTVQGNSTSVFEVGGIIIKTTDSQTGLYYRKSGYVNGSGFNGWGDRPSIDERITKLDCPVVIPAPNNQKVEHTIKFIQSSNATYPFQKTFYKLWFDGNEVSLPANGITVTWDSTEMSEDPTNFSGATGLAHVLSATNNCASGSEAAGESAKTIMDVHSFSYREFVPDPVTVSATTESGTVISPVGSLTFTFSEAVDEADLATGLIFEEDKLGSGDWSKRVCSYALDGKNLTVTFDEGDLASDSNYRFRFTTGIVAGETVFNYKTDATSNYYINDNFDRFPENNSIAAPGSDPTELDAPWWLGKKQYGRVIPSFVKENGDTVLRINSGGADTSNDMFGSVSYDNTYAPAVTGLESHKTVTEVEFTVQGNASSVFEIGGIIIKTTDGQTGLYYRKSGYVNGSGFNGWGDNPSIDERITSLTYPVAAPTDQKVLHTIKFIQTSDCEWPSVKTFHKLWFDGIEVPLPGGEISVSLDATEMKEDPVNYSGATGLAHLFSATNDWATTNEQPGISVRTIMDIHSYKYGPVDVKVTVADGAAANSKAITFTNNSGEDINNAVIVLAVYTNEGKTFVGFDGLTENVSVENAKSVTVTRTVANAAAGNTYKVIVLNSKVNLQPICDVASGAIG